MRAMRPSLLPLLAAVLVFAGCEHRLPINRGMAAGIADNVQRSQGLSWGDPIEVLTPTTPDADGHRWWQMRYAGGELRLIIVDAESGWGRLPPAGYVPRGRPQPPLPPQLSAAMVQDGSVIYALTIPAAFDDAGRGNLEREAARLNSLAAKTDLHPLFSVHTDHSGRVALIYGWQGDRGMARDEHVAQWVALRTGYAPTAQWMDLLAR